MKFNLNDFLELDTTALLAVNGGSDCGGGYSPPSTPSPSDGGPSTPHGGGGSGSGSSGGGYCSGASDGKTVYPNPYYKNGGKNSTSPGNVGGNCSRTDLDYWHTEYEKKVQACDDGMNKAIKTNITVRTTSTKKLTVDCPGNIITSSPLFLPYIFASFKKTPHNHYHNTPTGNVAMILTV